VIAEQGYEGAAGTDQDCRSQAVSLFISDTVACLDHTHGNGVAARGCAVTPAWLPNCCAVTPALRRNRRSRDAVTLRYEGSAAPGAPRARFGRSCIPPTSSRSSSRPILWIYHPLDLAVTFSLRRPKDPRPSRCWLSHKGPGGLVDLIADGQSAKSAGARCTVTNTSSPSPVAVAP
jgi:hypothetical protein